MVGRFGRAGVIGVWMIVARMRALRKGVLFCERRNIRRFLVFLNFP
jgi:hypothetical protein